MGKIGDGYGSEFHLKQYLDFRPEELASRVSDVIGAASITWIPCRDDGGRVIEWKGLDFLRASRIRIEWDEFWPRSGSPPNWDAIGVASINGKHEWLLVEAKAHVGELRSECAAVTHGGRPLIDARLSEVKQRLGASSDRDWMRGYYQYCNRIAVLDFLRRHDVAARLVFIYFTGDVRSDVECPQVDKDWASALAAQDAHVGLPARHEHNRAIHKLFVPVLRDNAQPTSCFGG